MYKWILICRYDPSLVRTWIDKHALGWIVQIAARSAILRWPITFDTSPFQDGFTMFKAPCGLAARYQEAKSILTQCLRALAYLHNHSCASAQWCFSADFFERVRAEKSFVATQKDLQLIWVQLQLIWVWFFEYPLGFWFHVILGFSSTCTPNV